MSDLDVKIIKLEPMRLASAHGFGKSPEGLAAGRMNAFLKKKGLLEG